MAIRAIAHRSLFLPILAALVALAWVVLWLWGRSPFAIFLDHSQMRALCLSGGPFGVLNLYVLGWMLMTAAMMLPTTFPLLEMFRRLTQQKDDQALLMGLLVAGYLAVWLSFGVAAHAADWLVLAAFDRIDPLGRHAWTISVGVLAIAGLFQFSTLKYRCLEKCRTPLSFVTRYWREQGGRVGAFLLGVRHGAFCVGCCWALMLLMFAVGAGNLGWMLALGAVMAVEKNLPWGRWLSPALGLGLLSWAGAIGLNHTIG
jgi:predicted metal-binding membrane protein